MATYIELETQEEFQRAVQIISAIDDCINILYNEFDKYSDLKEIVSVQDLIDRYSKKRLGLFELCAVYKNRIKTNNKEYDIYPCMRGDTLAHISQAFYNNADFAQYLYVFNNLETPLLEPFQKIKVPTIHPSRDKVYNKTLIDFMDDYAVERGLE